MSKEITYPKQISEIFSMWTTLAIVPSYTLVIDVLRPIWWTAPSFDSPRTAIKETIGSGGFAKVKIAKHKITGETVRH